MHRRVAVTAALLLAATGAPAQSEGENAAAIVKASLGRLVFRDSGADTQVRMLLTAPSGATRERKALVRSRLENGLARTTVNFLAPPDVAGTKFLLIENSARPDDQYIYLPALKRVRRIAANQRQSSFMGSDFTYADLEGRDIENAKYVKVGDETVGGANCHVIDATPTTQADSSYSRIRLWIRQDNHVGVRSFFYDGSGALAKKLEVLRVDTVKGRFVVLESRMETVSKNHRTTLVIDTIDFRDDLPADEFTVHRLEKG
jgi:outer membrane lipoprotein-sorting protein